MTDSPPGDRGHRNFDLVAPTCYSFMSLAPWRSPLARALHRNRSRADSRYPQLATIRPDGRPANRTVVFRDFWADTNRLLFVTDARSDKLHHIEQHRGAALCWYFTQTREQFRLGGELQALTADSDMAAAMPIRHDLWHRLSDNARQQFAWPSPGQPRMTTGYEPTDLSESDPLDTFAVLVFDPDTVDHLVLKGTPQNRWQYCRQPDHSWQMIEVNP